MNEQKRNAGPPPPWARWEKLRKIEHYRPMSPSLIYMPATTIRRKKCLDKTSILLRVVGAINDEASIADHIKNYWGPRDAYRINRQSYKIGFYDREDFERLRTKKWEYLGTDLILLRHWRALENNTEDPLDTVPQKAIIHNIPEEMWGDEAIGRITSSLGIPLKARVVRQHHPDHPPPLEACVIIGVNFTYPPSVKIRTEGNEGKPSRDIMVNIKYEQRVSYFLHCKGYGHWTQKYRREDKEAPGRWNKTIEESQPPAYSDGPNSGRNRETQKQNPRIQKTKSVVPDHIRGSN